MNLVSKLLAAAYIPPHRLTNLQVNKIASNKTDKTNQNRGLGIFMTTVAVHTEHWGDNRNEQKRLFCKEKMSVVSELIVSQKAHKIHVSHPHSQAALLLQKKYTNRHNRLRWKQIKTMNYPSHTYAASMCTGCIFLHLFCHAATIHTPDFTSQTVHKCWSYQTTMHSYQVDKHVLIIVPVTIYTLCSQKVNCCMHSQSISRCNNVTQHRNNCLLFLYTSTVSTTLGDNHYYVIQLLESTL